MDNGPVGVGRLVRLLDGGHLCMGILENYTPSPVAGELGTYSCVVFSPETIDSVTHETATQGSRTFGGNPVQAVAVVRLDKIRHVSDPYPGGWGQRFILPEEDAQVLLDLGEKAAASIDNPALDQPVVDAGGSGNAPDLPPEQPAPAPEPVPVEPVAPVGHKHKHHDS